MQGEYPKIGNDDHGARILAKYLIKETSANNESNTSNENSISRDELKTESNDGDHNLQAHTTGLEQTQVPPNWEAKRSSSWNGQDHNLELTESVLRQLEEQISSLDEQLAQNFTSPNVSKDIRISELCDSTGFLLPGGLTRARRGSTGDQDGFSVTKFRRKVILNRYIRHNLTSGSGCSCCLETEANEPASYRELIDEIEECFSRFCPSKWSDCANSANNNNIADSNSPEDNKQEDPRGTSDSHGSELDSNSSSNNNNNSSSSNNNNNSSSSNNNNNNNSSSNNNNNDDDGSYQSPVLSSQREQAAYGLFIDQERSQAANRDHWEATANEAGSLLEATRAPLTSAPEERLLTRGPNVSSSESIIRDEGATCWAACDLQPTAHFGGQTGQQKSPEDNQPDCPTGAFNYLSALDGETELHELEEELEWSLQHQQQLLHFEKNDVEEEQDLEASDESLSSAGNALAGLTSSQAASPQFEAIDRCSGRIETFSPVLDSELIAALDLENSAWWRNESACSGATRKRRLPAECSLTNESLSLTSSSGESSISSAESPGRRPYRRRRRRASSCLRGASSEPSLGQAPRFDPRWDAAEPLGARTIMSQTGSGQPSAAATHQTPRPQRAELTGRQSQQAAGRPQKASTNSKQADTNYATSQALDKRSSTASDDDEQDKSTSEQADERPGKRKSMRARARELARLSAPSLSALQYLPAKLDAKRRLSSRSHERQNLEFEAIESGDRSEAPLPMSVSSKLSSKVGANDESAGKHEDSCLLHRICLCTCMLNPELRADDSPVSLRRRKSHNDNDATTAGQSGLKSLSLKVESDAGDSESTTPPPPPPSTRSHKKHKSASFLELFRSKSPSKQSKDYEPVPSDNSNKSPAWGPARRLVEPEGRPLGWLESAPKEAKGSFLARSLNRLSVRAAKNKNQPRKESESKSELGYNNGIAHYIPISTQKNLKTSQRPFKNQQQQQLSTSGHLLPEIRLVGVEPLDWDSSEHKPQLKPAGSLQSSLNRPNHSGAVGDCLSLDGGRHLAGSPSSLGDLRRASSVPTSPRAGRLERRDRSPRLCSSPVAFRAPASQSSRIEDGLKVCSMEHFEKHIGNIRDNQLEAQKRLFAAWINHQRPNLIRGDLVEELRDGIKLVGLLASLTGDRKLEAQFERLVSDKQSYIHRLAVTPSSRLRQLANVSISVDYLRSASGLKLVNLNAMDVVSGKPNVVLGLCWNIILHFQLQQSLLKRLNKNNEIQLTGEPQLSDIPQELGPDELVALRKRLLDHLNSKFNLKLTQMSSNLLDGDVMHAIVERLIRTRRLELDCPDNSYGSLQELSSLDLDLQQNSLGIHRDQMDEEAKLEHCIQLASKYLAVPRLFSASDLRQQTLADNNSRPLLIYLSLLLDSERPAMESSGPTSLLCDHQSIQSSDVNCPETQLKTILADLRREDRFQVDKLKTSLMKIGQLESLVEALDESDPKRAEIRRYQEEAREIERLIEWLNQADGLFDSTPGSAGELQATIHQYQSFFGAANIPRLSRGVPCPSLERQLRECLSTAKQRVLFMEQTAKNWASYEEARERLRVWLQTAEQKLAETLEPIQSGEVESVEQQLVRLDELVDYFELESSACTKVASSRLDSISNFSVNLGTIDESRSICGSLNSLTGSLTSSSRLSSSLQSSKKASYYRLFDYFELKCRLLAAMLDPSQREALLVGVRELKSRLRNIADHRVPEVVNELRLSIAAALAAQVESTRPPAKELENNEENDEQVTLSLLDSPEYSSGPDEQPELRDEDSQDSPTEPNEQDSSLGPASSQETATCKSATSSSTTKASGQSNGASQRRQQQQYMRKRQQKVRVKRAKRATTERPNQVAKASRWSTLGTWLPTILAGKKQSSNEVSTTPKRIEPEKDDSDAEPSGTARRLWHKLVRASRASLSLNVVLLVCLAGLCLVPLMQRDACCELSLGKLPDNQPHIRRPV